jgi:putative membrane protein
MHHHYLSNAGSLTQWIPLLIIAAIASVYIYAIMSLQQERGGWSRWRSISFMSGAFLLGIAMIPTLMQWAHHDLRGHMVQHLLIGMFAPIFLVLGAPITLVLKILPVKLARAISSILKSKVFYCLSHPLIALLFNMGGMYFLYLTPLYIQSLANPSLHYIIHVHFLAAGYLFTWSLIGPDPAPKRPGLRLRLFVLFISIAAHAFLSKFMYAKLLPLNSPYSAEQIREGAKLMYYWGDLAEVFLLIALFTLWYQKRGHSRNKLSPLIP